MEILRSKQKLYEQRIGHANYIFLLFIRIFDGNSRDIAGILWWTVTGVILALTFLFKIL